MRWRIKNPAPLDSRLKKWGDYHFGRSLAKYLERLGEQVVNDYHPQWEIGEQCDVVLLLRGKYPLPASARHPGALHVIWNMSHPADVSLEEYESFDLVLVASDQRVAELAGRIRPAVHSFLQCTDTEEFFERSLPAGQGRRDLVFVGNTREQRRDGVLWAVEEGYPLKVWGRGWNQWISDEHVVTDYVPNETLGELYSASRISLNDHWPDMREAGFINNRIFDALACGLPIVSDRHPALERLFPDEVLYYSSREELVERLEQGFLSWSGVAAATRSAQERVRLEYSFAQRADRLLDLVSSQRGHPRGPHAPATGTASVAERALPSVPPPAPEGRWCPVCESHVPGFQPFGIAKRAEAQCPRCGALERHRSAWLFLKYATDLCDGREKLLLHPSPERHLGRILRNLPEVRYLGSDIVPEGVSVVLDLATMPFDAETVDAVYCSHVLEHIEADMDAMAELHRVLKPGGWALVMTPVKGDTTYEDPSIRSPEGRLAAFGQSDHVRLYGRDIRQRLVTAGFEVEEHHGELGFPEPYQRFMGLKRTYLYLCRRGAT